MMLVISKNNREEIENQFLALLLIRNELFDITQVKSQYLHYVGNAKIFEYCKECYDEFKIVDPVKVYEKHKDVDLLKISELLVETFYHERAWKEQMKLCEESIVKFYKEDVVNVMNGKLAKKEISYDLFMKKMKELDDIELIKGSTELNREEIIINLDVSVAEIKLGSFSKLSKNLKLLQGDFVIIGAGTGQGKSGFMLNLMCDLMNDYQCIYFNMEMSKSTIYRRLVAIESDIRVDDVVEPKSEYQKQLIEKAIQKIEDSKTIVEHKANDVKQIKNILMKYKDKERHTILFIDHMGLTRIDNPKNLYEQATEVAKELRQICLEYDCTIISASQLSREAYKSERPSLSMLKDSGELENSASKVILLYRDEEDKNNVTDNVKMKVDIVKNRDGVTGYVKMQYDKSKQIFKEFTDYYGG